MSAAFVRETEYQKLNEIESSLSALSFFLRMENDGQLIRESKSFFSEKCGRHIYAMSDGLNYALDDEDKWMVILKDC